MIKPCLLSSLSKIQRDKRGKGHLSLMALYLERRVVMCAPLFFMRDSVPAARRFHNPQAVSPILTPATITNS